MLILMFLVAVFVEGAVSYECIYTTYLSTSYTYCAYGCCSTTYSPCCSRPFYTAPRFYGPVGSLSLALLFAIISCVVWRRRRSRLLAAQSTAALPGAQVISTTTQANNSYSSYNSPVCNPHAYNPAGYNPSDYNPPSYYGSEYKQPNQNQSYYNQSTDYNPPNPNYPSFGNAPPYTSDPPKY